MNIRAFHTILMFMNTYSTKWKPTQNEKQYR